MLERNIAQWAIRFRLQALLLCIVIVGITATGIKQLTFDGSTRAFFGADHPHLLAYEKLEDTYGRVDSAILMVSAKEGDMFTPARLALLEQLTERLWDIPHALRVDSLSNFQYSHAENDELIVDDLIKTAIDYDEKQLALVRKRALSDPALINRLITPNGRHSALELYTELSEDNRRQDEEKEASDAIYQLVEQIEAQYPDIDIAVTGTVIGNSFMMESTVKDLSTIFPAMYALIFILLAVLLRSFLSMITIAITAIASCLSALGFAGWMGIELSPVAINSVTITITVAVAHCVHIAIFFLQLYRNNGDKQQALSESLRVNLQPMFITSFTTAIGFLSLNLNEMGPAANLGNIVAFGVMVAFVFSVALLPTLLLILPISANRSAAGTMGARIDVFAEWVIDRRKILLWATLLFSALMLILASQNVVNDRFNENIKKPHVFRTDGELIDKQLGGLYTIEYSMSAKSAGGISTIEYLNNLDKFTQWLRAQPEVISVFSYSDTIQRLNQNMHNGNADWHRIPANRELAAQYLLLYEISLSAEQDLSNQISSDQSETRLVIKFPTMDSANIMTLHLKIIDWQKQNLPVYMQDDGASYAVMWSYLARDATQNSMKGALTALLLISMILSLVFRSLRYGVISMIPNLLPAGIGYGFWYVFVGEMSMALMSVLSITIGIVVDDTVHFLSKYLRAIKEKGADTLDAVRYAFHSVGPALWITTLVLIAGFSVQAFSLFRPSGHMGMLIAGIIAAALVLDFLMLPPLLMWFDRNKKRLPRANSQP